MTCVQSYFLSIPFVPILTLRRYTSLTGIDGTLSPSIGLLTGLQELFLYNNSMHGSLPSAVSSLTDLRELALGYAPITGVLPPELCFADLSTGLHTLGTELSCYYPCLRSVVHLDVYSSFSPQSNQPPGPLPMCMIQGVYISP